MSATSATGYLKHFEDWEVVLISIEDGIGLFGGIPLLLYVIYTIFNLPKPMKTFHKCIIFTCGFIIFYNSVNTVYEMILFDWFRIPEFYLWLMDASIVMSIQLSEVSMAFVSLHFRSLVTFRSKKDVILYALEIFAFSVFFTAMIYARINKGNTILVHVSNGLRCLAAFVLLAIMSFSFYQIYCRPTTHYSPNTLRIHRKMLRYLAFEVLFQSYILFRVAFRSIAYDENSLAYNIYFHVVLLPLHTLPIWRGLLFYHVVTIARSAIQTRVKTSHGKTPAV